MQGPLKDFLSLLSVSSMSIQVTSMFMQDLLLMILSRLLLWQLELNSWIPEVSQTSGERSKICMLGCR